MKYVTRELKGTKITTINMNIQTCEPYNETYILPFKYSEEINNEKLLKKAQSIENARNTETDTNRVVEVLTAEQHNQLIGMPETDFISAAVELNPKTRKPYENE